MDSTSALAFGEHGVATGKLKDHPKHQKDQHSYLEVAKRVCRAYLPLRIVMWSLGRFPVSLGKKENGILCWQAKKYSLCHFLFSVNCLVHFSIFFLFVINAVGITLNGPKITSQYKDADMLHVEEWFLFRRNTLPFIVVFVNSLHVVICCWTWIWKRKFLADFFNFWIASEHQMKVKVTGNAVIFSISLLVSYALILFCFLIAAIFQPTPICTGGPTILVQMVLRVFYPDVHTWKNFPVYRTLATVLFFYIMICSKIHVMFFMVQCHMIKHTIREWNNRVEEALNSDMMYTDIELVKLRTSGTMLFQDQVCILDVIDANDITFTNIIESFYFAQVVTMVFEVYFIYRVSQNEGDFHGVRRYDVNVVAFHLLFTMLFMLLVSVVAGQVGEETLNGIQSVRNKGLLGRKNEAHLNLILSMYYNYVGFWEAVVNGGKYFPINKQLFMKGLAMCMTYVFCVIQFEMGFRYIKDRKVPMINFAELMKNVEYVNEGWWGTTYKRENYLDKTGVDTRKN